MKTAVIGLGNPLKKDDNIGNVIIEKLEKEVKGKNLVFIKAYLTPENYLLLLKKDEPENVYIIDAVEFEGKVGDVKVFNLDEINQSRITTHNIPVNIYQDYFPNSVIKLIGIKVKDVSFGEELSKEIKDKLEDIFKEVKKIIS